MNINIISYPASAAPGVPRISHGRTPSPDVQSAGGSSLHPDPASDVGGRYTVEHRTVRMWETRSHYNGSHHHNHRDAYYRAFNNYYTDGGFTRFVESMLITYYLEVFSMSTGNNWDRSKVVNICK